HCKAIAVDEQARDLVNMSYVANYLKKDPAEMSDMGLIIGNASGKTLAKQFISAIGQHRFFEREKTSKIPA
ncbi:MAG: hypothetical protein ABI204_06755, partial [Ginsengibacter sp.]